MCNNTNPRGKQLNISRLAMFLSCSDSIMSLTFDEYGRPFIIIREQGKKMRLKGRDAQKVDFAHTRPHLIALLPT